LVFKPIRGLHISAEAFVAQHGPYVEYITGTDVITAPFMESVAWQNKTYALDIRYEIVSNVYIYANATKSNITGDQAQIDIWTPAYYQGSQLTFSAGFNVGF